MVTAMNTKQPKRGRTGLFRMALLSQKRASIARNRRAQLNKPPATISAAPRPE